MSGLHGVCDFQGDVLIAQRRLQAIDATVVVRSPHGPYLRAGHLGADNPAQSELMPAGSLSIGEPLSPPGPM
jgi:hypothetical protein